MSEHNGFRFKGQGKLNRIDTFTTKAGKEVLTLIFEEAGQWPQWIPIKVFGRAVEMASDCKPGDIVAVTGRLGGRDWNGKVYGECIADSVEVVGQRELPTGAPPAGGPPPSDDDVPF